VTLTRIDVVDADGDGSADDSVASFHSNNPVGTHDQDDLGSITFIDHVLTSGEVEIFDGIFAGVLQPEDTNLFPGTTSSGADAPVFVSKPNLIGKMQMMEMEGHDNPPPYYSVDQLSEKQSKIYRFSAEDPNGLPLTYSISGEDASGLKITPTGTLYAPMGLNGLGASADGDGRFSVDVTVTNSSGASSVMHFDFRVDYLRPEVDESQDDDGPIFLLDSYDIETSIEETIASSNESRLIKQFVALDANGDAVSYLLSGEDAASDSFVFDTATGTLEASVDLDQLGMSADGDGNFEFVVTAIDGHGNTTDLQYTFNLQEADMSMMYLSDLDLS
jgi:hypothetical protein